MPITSKQTSAWTETITSSNGCTVSVSGTSGSDMLTVEVYVPGSGYGPAETPDSRTSTTISLAEWCSLVMLVEAKVPASGPSRTERLLAMRVEDACQLDPVMIGNARVRRFGEHSWIVNGAAVANLESALALIAAAD